MTSKKTATDLLESAMIHHAGGNSPAGINQLQEAIFLDPRLAPAWNNRGCILKQLGNNFDAMLNFDRAIEIDPSAAEFHNNRGAALSDMGQFSQAEQAYRKAIELKPRGAESMVNLGNALKAVGRTQEALAVYRQATEVKPDYADGHLNYSFALLEAGRLEEGWKEFEWRWKCGQLPPRGLDIPEWQGDSLEGHALLLYAEQGMGDALHFMRYAPILKEKFGGKVYIEVRQTLARAAMSMGGFDGVIAFGEKIPAFIDRILPMMSAPRICGTTLDNIPAPIPYIHPDKHRASLFEKEYKKLPFQGVRVGICWAGHNREGNAGASAIDRRRSTTLASFAPLARVPGISWVSLQKGDPENQVMRPPQGMTVLHCMDDCEDFYDTAALMDTLDLIITVDTSVVHLAGAVGKPVWMLGRYDGCWRWLGDRKDNPWYPTLTHFRQPAPGDWETLMHTVTNELRKFVAQRRTLKAV